MAFELLEALGSEQIQELQQDVRLLGEGYELLTVVDTFDICEYCFPFGIEFDKKLDKSMGALGDEQFSYDFLFKKMYVSGKPIVIEEYKIELFNVRNKILRLSEDMLNRRNNLESEFIRPILDEKDPIKRKDRVRELQNTLSFLISYALSSQTSVARYCELLEEGYLADMRQTEDDLLREIFDSSNQELVPVFKRVFEEWVGTRRAQLKNVTDKSDLVNELNSVYKDVMACVRVLIANKRLAEAGVRKVVLLHSSTPDRTESIIRTSSFQEMQQSSEPGRLSFVRNKSHTFLLSLLWQPTKDKGQTVQEVSNWLSDLMTVAKTYEQLQKVNGSYNKKSRPGLLIDKSDQIMNSARAAFEQSLLLAKLQEFGNYKTQIEELLKRLEETNDEYGSIIDLYNKWLKEAKMKASGQRAGLALENVKNVYALQLNISTLVRGIIRARRIKVTKGNDMIRGSFHHLPFLIFLRERNFDRKAKKILDPLIDFCLKPERIRRLQTNDILNVLGEFSNFEERFRETPTISLLSLFLMLLLPVAEEKRGGDSEGSVNEENALQNAERLWPIYEQLPRIFEGNAIDYFKELRYVMVWLYRRCRRYDESLNLAKVCIDQYQSDPRFYHGKCLALYSKYLDNERRQFPELPMVDEVIRIARYSMDLYGKEAETDADSKITYTIGALLNTLAHLYCIRYDFSAAISDLALARENYEELQRLFDGNERPSYSEYPELLHTGAFLEFQTAREEKTLEQWEQAIMRLDLASELSQAALAMIPDSTLYQGLRQEIIAEGREIRKIVVKETKQGTKNKNG